MPKTSFTVSEAWPAVAIGAGIYVTVKLVGGLMPTDGATDEQTAARAQTNEGSPVDAPGQKLIGEDDYIKIYKGQKVDALKRFGETTSSNSKAYPLTPKAYGRGSIVNWWAAEISRLVGFNHASTLNKLFDEDRPLDVDDLSPRFPASVYNGLVSKDSARSILATWNRLVTDLNLETRGADVMTSQGTVRFWDLVNELAIAVDVDRAVPETSGYAWVAIYESAQEAPGVLGDAVAKITKEASGALWRVFGAAAINVLFSPLGLALAGASVWLYRGELAALSRRL